jgi:hypothetical protein
MPLLGVRSLWWEKKKIKRKKGKKKESPFKEIGSKFSKTHGKYKSGLGKM